MSNLKKNQATLKKSYLPRERDYLEEEPEIERSYPKYDYTPLPHNVQSPIVCNNIADVEFNYTCNEEDDNIFNDDLFQELDNVNIEK